MNSEKSTPTLNNTVRTSIQTPKRKLVEISPDKMENNVVNMPTSDLLQMMATLLDKKLDEKMQNLPTKSDLLELKENIGDVKTEVSRLSTENDRLQEEMRKLKEERKQDQQRMMLLERDLVKKKLIIRGLESQPSSFKAVKKAFKENFKMNKNVEIEQTRKIYEKNQKMTVMVEFKSANTVAQVFKHTKNLAGSSIQVERELCKERQLNKKVMLCMKKEILQVEKNIKINVRDDNMIINKKQLYWNRNKILMCGEEKGDVVLKSIYGEKLDNLNLEYDKILEKVNSKN